MESIQMDHIASENTPGVAEQTITDANENGGPSNENEINSNTVCHMKAEEHITPIMIDSDAPSTGEWPISWIPN